jgi:hypothetical protein
VNRFLIVLCAFIALACFAPVVHIAAAPQPPQPAVMPAISPALPVATVEPQGSQPGSVWPMLGLTAVIAAGGLALMRKIANTLS